jgi:stage II sporulation protein Q
MNMKEQKTIMDKQWFWPVVYTVIALLVVAFILLYNMFVNVDEDKTVLDGNQVAVDEDKPIETSVQQESMRYPFDELYVDKAVVVQDFYDATADAADQQDALVVFKNTYTTSNGISIAINEEPFQVLASMSGIVKSVEVDAFTGNTVTLEHANGFVTKYSSLSDIVVEEGDEVLQGNPLGMAVANESNPQAGVHVHFQIMQEGAYINPRSLLAF